MDTSRNFSKLLINEPPLQVLPSLAGKLGLNGAIFLQQVHYWISMPTAREREGRRWVYNSLPQWQEQFPFWSEDTIQRTIAALEKQGVLLSGNYNERAFDKTKWYSIDYAALDALEVTPPSRKTKRPSRETASPSPQLAVTTTADCSEDDRNLHRPIPETNTETNTETTVESAAAPRAPAGRKLTPGVNAPKPTPAIPLPRDWPLDPTLRTWAMEDRGLTADQVDEEHEQFCNHYWSITHDKRRGWRSDWAAAERGWFFRRDQFAPAPKQKGSTHGRTYESPGERREREWMESIASIYGAQPAPGDHRGTPESQPPAVPARTPETRVISLNDRRVG